jgi:hypothetical protein
VSQEQAKDIWCLLEEAASHLRQNPPPEGCWEDPEDRDMHLIEVLPDHAADPNRPDMNRQTALDIAWGRTAEVLRGQGGQANLNTASRLGLVEQV